LNTTVKGLVSVVLPNRDHAHYLPTALDAVLAQSRRDLEILVIDDGSSDNSKDVVQDYAARDSRVHPIYLTENVGVNGAVEAAMPHIRGEYLCTAAADDFVAPAFFANSVRQLERFPAAGLCFSDPTECYEPDQRLLRFPLYLSTEPVYYDPESLQRLMARNHFSISSNTVIYRTDAFRDAGGYQDELGWLSDWFVTAAVALRHGACYLPEALTFHRIRKDSFSALTLKDAASHRYPFNRFLTLLSQPAYADVAAAMQAAGVIPEYRLRTLRWLSESEEGRKFLSPHLVIQISAKSLWSLLRPISPTWLRRELRRASSRRAEKDVSGDRA
jgi:glycosyltransferase involved in cell wall biosynthesis